MKLLAPNVGWAMSGRGLMWTSSGGTEWEDITPPAAKGAVISGVFFLDTNRGWVLFEHGEPDIPGGLQFDLASTDNAGATWSMRHLSIPERKYSESDILHGGILVFADSVHGWLGLGEGLSAASRGNGVLLATGDGGESWKLATTTGWEEYDTVGSMLMLTPEQGWMVSGGANEELLVTRDGAKTWQRIELESPVKTDQMREYDRNFEQFEQSFQRTIPAAAKLARKEPQHPSYAAYDLPTFDDPKHGHVSVTYPGVTVLFATDDGGVTWKPEKVVEGRPIGASAVVDSNWITVRVAKDGMPRLANVAPAATTETGAPSSPEDRPADEIDFVTASQGWVVTLYGKLLATNDGGATWTDITPGWPTAATP
ncbi:WD40/YVTN/BNR-like repeat-containing protein [Candidatus Binatus sp.]|jgi:photosystem II stability/assembly factor-like uncharacterized protein|uniref:WD40/YVTN/BNR-like repeat-containing protein n=1 Tax=Candidatus Binatus sp. TaxID=2811406 RepID=UPI003BCD5FAD